MAELQSRLSLAHEDSCHAFHCPIVLYQRTISLAPNAHQSHKLIYFNEVDKGGHFAAWEQPDLFAAEIRAAFRPLR
jgi:pimeloyl-ACP methyl ester carboxylesterase